MKTKQHLKMSLNYAILKADEVKYYNIFSQPYEQMMETKKIFCKDKDSPKSEKRKTRMGYQFYFSMPHNESDAIKTQSGRKEQYQLMLEEVLRSLNIIDRFEVVTALHTDQKHLHSHIIFNSVSCMDGRMYHYNDGDFDKYFRKAIDPILQKFGFEKIKDEKEMDHFCRKEMMAEKHPEKISYRKLIRDDIAFYRNEVHSLDALLEILQKKEGYEFYTHKKYIAIRYPTAKSFIRLNSLKGEFTEESLRTFYEKKAMGFEENKIQFTIPKQEFIPGLFKIEHPTPREQRMKDNLLTAYHLRNGAKNKQDILAGKKIKSKDVIEFEAQAKAYSYIWKYHIDSHDRLNEVIQNIKDELLKIDTENSDGQISAQKRILMAKYLELKKLGRRIEDVISDTYDRHISKNNDRKKESELRLE